jgi:hypothetical protein
VRWAVIAIATFTIVGAVRFWDSFDNWFIFDDPRAMFYATRPLTDIFFSRMYAASYYTPLLGLSMRAEALAIGLNPLVYHIHNALAAIGVAAIVYFVSRRITMDPVSRIVGALVVLLSPAMFVAVSWITLRQYLYAVLLSLIAVELYLLWAKNLTFAWTLAGALLACQLSYLGKEQFITLPGVLFLLTPGTLRRRAVLTSPFFAAAGLHVLLRYYVLGGIGGGPQVVEASVAGYARSVALSLPRTADMTLGTPLAAVLVVLALWFRTRVGVLSLAVWGVALATAFLAMGTVPFSDDYRYWLQATVLFGFGIVVVASLIGSRSVRWVYCAAIIGAAVWHSASGAGPLTAHFERESRIALALSEGMRRPDLSRAVVLWPSSAYAHSDYIAFMARLYEREGIAPAFPPVYPIDLVARYPELLRGVASVYEIQKGTLREASSAAVREAVEVQRRMIVSLRPRLELKGGRTLDVDLECPGPASTIRVFAFRGWRLRFVDETKLAFQHKFSTGLVVDRKVRVSLVPIERVLGEGVGDQASADGRIEWSGYAVACDLTDGRTTLLSDAILVGREW